MSTKWLRHPGKLLVGVLLCLLVGVLSASAAVFTVVTPGNPDGWGPTDVRSDATVGITTAQPRNGDGSLQFQTITVTPGQDKADFTKTWVDATRTLPAVTKVAFEYYRDSSSTTAAHYIPVLRLLFYHDAAPAGQGAEDSTGYLIWEGAYNGINPAPTDSWQSEDVTADYFWMRLVSGPTYVGGCERTIQNFSVTLNDWLTNNPQGLPGDCVAPDLGTGTTYIYGINTGVGSGWGANFLGYVDSIELYFGADTVTADFEPDPQCSTVCYADAVNGNDANDGITPATAKKTIQAAIDQVDAAGQVRVLPGSYDETATNRFVLGVNGPHQFGLFIEDDTKDGISIIGVTAADVEITDPNATEADITTNATNNFGTSGIFVEADDVTITGLEIGPNTPGENKTIEIIGDNFALTNSFLSGDGVDGASIYFGDWRYDSVNDVSYITEYTIDNNLFGAGSIITIASGAGVTGPVSGRIISNNDFTNGTGQTRPSISFRGAGGQPWYVYPVGGATITGNTFHNDNYGALQWIRATGNYVEAQFDWASFWNDNTYDNATVTYDTSLADPRTFTDGLYPNVRRIGAQIQTEIDTVALSGDTVLVNEGTYPESPTIDKALVLLSDDGRDLTFIELQTGTNYAHSLLITGVTVTVDGFTIVGIDDNCPDGAATNIYLNTAPDHVFIVNNRMRVGAIGACSTIDMGFGLITEYSGNPDVTTLTVDNNIFEPLNTSGGRAFYINPSVVNFIFTNNEITGQFTGTAITQAQSNLIQLNTVTGTGASAGIGVWGDPDPTVWGQATIDYNTITGTANAISIYEAEDVNVNHNILNANGRAVRVLTVTPLAFNQSKIHINRNAITNNTNIGIDNQLDQSTYGDVDGTCNWWNSATGPGLVASGSGDKISADVTFTPWLYADDLDGPCYVGGTIEVRKVTDPASDTTTEFTFDPTWSATNFTLKNGESETTDPPLQPGPYSVIEVEPLPTGWSLETAVCVNEREDTRTPLPTADPSLIPVEDGDEWVCTFTNVFEEPPPAVCPANSPYVGNETTRILGLGLYPYQSTIAVIKDPQLVTGLYAQLAGKKLPKSTYTMARFIPRQGTTNLGTVDDGAVDSAEFRDYAVFWYGESLDGYVNLQDPSQNPDRVLGRLFVTPGSATNMGRALILYPDYATRGEFFNYASVREADPAAQLAISNQNHVYWQTSAGWYQTQTYEVDLGGPLAEGRPLQVQTAVVDNDPDKRPVWLTIRVVDDGGAVLVETVFKPTGPTNGKMLNINRPVFDAPAGAAKVVITLSSPYRTGDSAALVGVAVNYPCASPVR